MSIPNTLANNTIADATDLNENFEYFQTVIENGWINARETWTYASATTFTVASDVTGKYQKGDKLKCTNDGSTKYFFIISATYVDPNTTITVTGEVDLANAVISDNYFSKSESPQGIINPIHLFRARAYRAGSQTLANATFTKLNYEFESYDPNGDFDLTNERYVAPISGYYRFSASLGFSFNGDYQVIIRPYKDGSYSGDVAYENRVVAVTDELTDPRAHVASEIYLAKNSYLEMYGYQDSGDTRTIDKIYMEVQFVGL